MSPIEKMFEDAFRALGSSDVIINETQTMIDGYKVDILLSIRRVPCWLIVELDGHDWHERTKQQASYDRARDRALLRAGFPTIRFTGSDIYRDANQCARESVETLQAISSHFAGYGERRAAALARPRGAL